MFKKMKKITKFFLNVTFVGSILSIATLNALQLTVVGQPTPNVDGQPITQPGRVRFVGPTEDNLPNYRRGLPIPAGLQCDYTGRGKRELTALVPISQIGRTVSEYPVFFFYLPQTDAEVAEFTLQDENGNLIYEQDLTIKNLSGVIGVSIPANKNVPPLEAGKNYRWYIALICDPDDRSADAVAIGIVRRVELSAEILRKLENADPRQKTVIYAENGIWQDALSNLAAVRRANPNEPAIQSDWESLLGSVELGEIAAKPLVPIEPQP
jgi:hypothetical protein